MPHDVTLTKWFKVEAEPQILPTTTGRLAAGIDVSRLVWVRNRETGRMSTETALTVSNWPERFTHWCELPEPPDPNDFPLTTDDLQVTHDALLMEARYDVAGRFEQALGAIGEADEE